MEYIFSQTAVYNFVNSEIGIRYLLDFFSLKSFVRQDAAIRYRKQDNSLVVFSLETGPGGARQFLVGSPGIVSATCLRENCHVANPTRVVNHRKSRTAH
jgi:hypothetical protein